VDIQYIRLNELWAYRLTADQNNNILV